MHLYPCAYLYFYATVLMKQYLIILYATWYKISGYYEFNFFLHTIYPQLCMVPL